MSTAVNRHPDKLALAAAERVIAGAGRVAEPFATAEMFPAEAYTGADFWRFERWALFEREWLCVGHVNQVPAPGDIFRITMLDEPLLIIRDKEGEIRVLSAICQHRGHPLLDGLGAPAAPGVCSHAELLICPYHAWSYTLDGALYGAPGMNRTAPLAELRRRIRLPRIRHCVVHGLIFINFDGDAAPLEPTLNRMVQMIDGFGLAEMIPSPSTSSHIGSNWKLYQENALEPYHTDTVHRASHQAAPSRLSAFYEHGAADGAIMTTTAFTDANELFVADERLPPIPGLSAEQNGRLLFIAVLPSLFLVLEPSSVVVTLVLPIDAESMTLQTFSLHPGASTRVADFARRVDEQMNALQVIRGEDIVTQEALQRGHRSRFTPAGTLSWLETTLPQMNRWLVDRYRRALDRIAAGAGTENGACG
jgi:phenylpropionate dioxygenase-like ring-hydroxylating dioxygenase large terminal subunit